MSKVHEKLDLVQIYVLVLLLNLKIVSIKYKQTVLDIKTFPFFLLSATDIV